MSRGRRRVAGVLIGIVLGAALLAGIERWQAGRERPVGGRVLSECDGTIRAIAIQYTADGDFALGVYRQLVPLLESDVAVWVICPKEEDFAALRQAVGPVRCTLRPVIVGHEMSVWSRDRWLTLVGPAGTTLLTPRGEQAAESWPARAGDQRLGRELAEAMGTGYRHRTSNLFFDAGDFCSDGRIILGNRALARRNIQHTVEDREALAAALRRELGREVVMLDASATSGDATLQPSPGSLAEDRREPPSPSQGEGQYGGCPDHHIGMFMMFAGDGVAVVGDPSAARGLYEPALLDGQADESAATQAQFDAVAGRLRSLGYKVVRIPTIPATDGRTYLTYVNVLIDQRDGRRIIYMPTYLGAEALNAAAERVWRDLGHDVRPIDCTDVYRRFGTLHCLMNVVERG